MVIPLWVLWDVTHIPLKYEFAVMCTVAVKEWCVCVVAADRKVSVAHSHHAEC